MTWIKICGITNLEDAQMAVDAGADALGFVFYEKSPRKVDLQTVQQIIPQLPEKIEKVGVFVDPDRSTVLKMVSETGINKVQIHGRLPVGLQKGLSEMPGATTRQVIRAISGNWLTGEGGFVIGNKLSLFATLIDSTSTSGVAGGTGATFDWESARPMIQAISRQTPVIIAGGLTPLNVGEAIRFFQPFGVDVASGVESSPGKKDPAKVRAFIDAVRREDRHS